MLPMLHRLGGLESPLGNDAAAESRRPLDRAQRGRALGETLFEHGDFAGALRELVAAWNVPFITASMARGVVPDSDENCVNAARSMALANADVVLVFGSPLNWQLHFGQPPKWSSDATFISCFLNK